jgi:BlaI family transcriptional regulator, penicillinase repressor
MLRSDYDVPDAELAVLQGLWDLGPATVRQLTGILYPETTAAKYATVQKLLERLEEKGFVQRSRDTWPHVFQAIVQREELIGRQLRAVAEKLCGGSLAPLLTHLLRVEPLNTRERKELRSFMDDIDQQAPS